MKRVKTPLISKTGHFRRFLREKRMNARFSQVELAEILGYTSGQYISNIERGTCPFPTENLPLLAKVLQVPLAKLIRLLSRDFENALYERFK